MKVKIEPKNPQFETSFQSMSSIHVLEICTVQDVKKKKKACLALFLDFKYRCRHFLFIKQQKQKKHVVR